MTERARAVLVTPDRQMLTIRRVRPGQVPYCVLPGGGIDDGETPEKALARELREELAAAAEVHSLVYIHDDGSTRQYVYLARAHTWSAKAGDRTGPEFRDPARGQYHVQAEPLTPAALAAINLKPDAVAGFLLDTLQAGTDLFSLPDLRGTKAAADAPR